MSGTQDVSNPRWRSSLARLTNARCSSPFRWWLFRSATILDARAIIERAHHVGAHVVLDVFQATGRAGGRHRAPDGFCRRRVLKWLCGGPGVAYLLRPPDCARSSPRRSPAGRAQAAV